jgi:hypothetical protein
MWMVLVNSAYAMHAQRKRNRANNTGSSKTMKPEAAVQSCSGNEHYFLGLS